MLSFIIPTYNEKDNIGLLIPEIKTLCPISIFLSSTIIPRTAHPRMSRSLRRHTAMCSRSTGRQRKVWARRISAGFDGPLNGPISTSSKWTRIFHTTPSIFPIFLRPSRTAIWSSARGTVRGVNVVNWPMSRLLLSYFSNILIRIIAGVPVRDCTAGFKCFRRSVLETINLDKIDSSGYFFQIEVNYMAWKNKFRILEIPIVFTDRKRGVSKMSTKIIREALVLLWKLRLMSTFKRTEKVPENDVLISIVIVNYRVPDFLARTLRIPSTGRSVRPRRSHRRGQRLAGRFENNDNPCVSGDNLDRTQAQYRVWQGLQCGSAKRPRFFSATA